MAEIYLCNSTQVSWDLLNRIVSFCDPGLKGAVYIRFCYAEEFSACAEPARNRVIIGVRDLTSHPIVLVKSSIELANVTEWLVFVVAHELMHLVWSGHMASQTNSQAKEESVTANWNESELGGGEFVQVIYDELEERVCNSWGQMRVQSWPW